MKKYLLFFVSVIIFLSAFSLQVNASSLSEGQSIIVASERFTSVKFEITSGLDTTKDIESTFDKQRTITGSSEANSEIYIIVSQKRSSGNLVELGNYKIKVGATGLFSQTIILELGENQIDIKVEKAKREPYEQTFFVKRKDREIKMMLEQRIVMPGDVSPNN